MRKTRVAAAMLTATLAACGGAKVRPTANKDFTTQDVKNCWDVARNVNTTLGAGGMPGSEERPIKATIFMYVDTDGSVPAAFIHDGNDVPSNLAGCLVDHATEAKFSTENTDYVRPQPVVFTGTSGRLAQLHEQPPGKIDENLAKSTLQFAGWATPADKGWGYYLTHDYQKALEQFRAAVAANPNDAQAQRGLAVTLVDSGGDAKAARAAADAAVKAQPDSVAAQEALARVCLAQKDDKCALEAWETATKGQVDQQGNVTKPVDSAQKQARSFTLAEIQDQVKAANDRYSEEAGKERAQAQQEAQAKAEAANDPTGCGKFPEGDERTVCFAKYCFADGAKAYGAKDLKSVMGSEYTPGSWKASKGKGGATNVSVQLRSKGGGAPRTATWAVKVGDNVSMVPQDIDAANISKSHNACNKK